VSDPARLGAPEDARGGRVGAATAALRLTGRLSLLVASLRAGGVRVGVGELVGAHRALAAVDASSRPEAYFALRASLCSRHEDLEVFDSAFEECFPSRRLPVPEALDDVARVALPRAPGAAGPRGHGGARLGPPAELDSDPVPAAWSDVELLREKDFAEYSEAERALARRLLARLATRGPVRRSRRARPVRHRGEVHDLRATARASLRHGGEPVERRWRGYRQRARPLVLVCDVSGSMEPYARMLLQYLHAAVGGRRRVEAFAFGTRLTRITRELAARDPDRALRRAAAVVDDWSGGTRIGASLAQLNREHGGRLGRGAVVVVLSDGWDRGDPELLAAEMARLRRCAHRVLWLNPLAGHPDYAPLTRGMAAAMPHTDHLLAGNSLASLEELADLLEKGASR
jgi:uncharacterized protein with von Willebrand factor type A (vWA) domain